MGDLEDFLREAAERARAKRQQAAGGRKKAARPPVAKPPAEAGPPRPPKPAARKTSGEGVADHVEKHLGGSRVADHVAEHLATERVASRAESLGEAIAREEKVIEADLAAKFGERDDTFEHAASAETYGRAEASHGPEGATVDALLALFRSPAQLRQAILASEILRRPEERW